jgi:acyl-CoA thioester hydrolase
MTRRERTVYFKSEPADPKPLCLRIKRRARFSEVDPMGIVWFGRYATYFEEGSTELGRVCGLSFKDFMDNNLRAPVAQCHIDYLQPIRLDEEFVISSTLAWNDGARLNTEYALLKGDGSIAIRGYTVQLFTNALDGQVCMTTPPLLERCRRRWLAGEFKELQS